MRISRGTAGETAHDGDQAAAGGQRGVIITAVDGCMDHLLRLERIRERILILQEGGKPFCGGDPPGTGLSGL